MYILTFPSRFQEYRISAHASLCYRTKTMRDSYYILKEAFNRWLKQENIEVFPWISNEKKDQHLLSEYVLTIYPIISLSFR